MWYFGQLLYSWWLFLANCQKDFIVIPPLPLWWIQILKEEESELRELSSDYSFKHCLQIVITKKVACVTLTYWFVPKGAVIFFKKKIYNCQPIPSSQIFINRKAFSTAEFWEKSDGGFWIKISFALELLKSQPSERRWLFRSWHRLLEDQFPLGTCARCQP